MSKIALALILCLLIVSLCSAATLPEIFKQAKDAFGRGDYKQSLADFDLLDAESQKPGFEADRAKLAPVILFYRGANLAALGKKDEAKETFISYLIFMPNASIASPPFPKDVVALFDAARKEADGRSNTVSAAFATFMTPAGWSLPTDEHWTETPVRYLLTPAQKQEYESLTTPADRATFADRVWGQLDPTPGTPANEFRAEFERRVAFADATWTTEKAPGRIGDRATVIVFLGPPTYAAMGSLGTADDTMSAMRARGNADMDAGLVGKSRRGTSTARAIQKPTDNLEQDYNRGGRESWVYRQDRMPKDVPFHEIRVDFLSKQGYGAGVLQKEPQVMQTLGGAVDAALRDKKFSR
ncbi:MAG: GWxTD domain-containing protein [Acidobacteriota bacterium]